MEPVTWATTWSGTNWLGSQAAAARRSPRTIAILLNHVLRWRIVTVVALLAGMLTVPVSCALAAGPHSLFVDPADPASSIERHVHYQGIAVALSADAPGDRVPSQGAIVAYELPSAESVVSVVAAVLGDRWLGELPRQERARALSQTDVAGRVNAPEAPPPR